jgi:quinoprotein glucose dehydrogenase
VLNSGTIKSQVPLGEDAHAAAEGAKDTGIFLAEHHGIIVTSTELLFVVTSDGKVRTHDQDTGNILWIGSLPAGSEGIPAMYEVGGRQFLVVSASSSLNSGGDHRDPSGSLPTTALSRARAHVSFALPETQH